MDKVAITAVIIDPAKKPPINTTNSIMFTPQLIDLILCVFVYGMVDKAT